MKAIMMSIRPEWVRKILNGEKTIEIRKKFPKDYVGWVYIYATKDTSKGFLYKVRGYGYRLEDEIDVFLPPKNGKVVARFWCDKVEEIAKGDYYPSDDLMSATMWYEFHTKTMDEEQILKKSCLRKSELHNYLNLKRGYAIHITKVEPFDKPKELKEFYTTNLDKDLIKLFDNSIQLPNGTWVKPLTRAPQSWCYIEV